MNLLQRIRKLITEDYYKIEIWSWDDPKAKRKAYVNRIIDQLKESHPYLEILSKKRTDMLSDFNRNPFSYGSVKGYIIKITPNVDLFALKETCMKLEFDEQGERVSDIDIFLYDYKKFSRKEYL